MSAWYRTLLARPKATKRLVIIPHAGGGPAYYRELVQDLREDLEPVAVQLPGREGRWKEPPFTRMESLIGELTSQLKPLWDRPIVLFGHSLGAVIAYELARRLPTERLIVAGARAAQLPRARSLLHELTDDALRREMTRLGGTPSQVLENEELLGLFLPVLRADLEVLETYSHQSGPPVDVPLTVLGGWTDERTPLIDLLPWQELNRGATEISAYPGGHFFLRQFDHLFKAQDAVDLYVLRLKRDPAEVAVLATNLDESEQHAAQRFLRPEHRDRYTICRGSLRNILGQRLKMTPRDVRLTVSPSGKPQLQASHQSGIRFNLSHSEDLAVIAVSNDNEVGVDVEQIRSDVDHVGLAERYFAAGEREDVLKQQPKDRSTRFFTYWTGKEAYSKARGLGLNLPLDEYDILLDERGYPRAVDDRTLPASSQVWHVAGLNLADGFAAAIASQNLTKQIRLFAS